MNLSHFWIRSDPNYYFHIVWICLTFSLTGIFIHLQMQNPQTLKTVGSLAPQETTTRPTLLPHDPLDLGLDSGNNRLLPFIQNGSSVSAALVCWIRTIPHQPIIWGILITRHTLPYISIITPFCPLMRIFRDEGGRLLFWWTTLWFRGLPWVTASTTSFSLLKVSDFSSIVRLQVTTGLGEKASMWAHKF